MQYFEWNVDRIIFNIWGPLSLRWYSILFLIGFIVGYFAFKSFMRHEGRSTAYADSLLNYLVIGTVVGARLGHCLFYDPWYYLSQPWEILKVWEGGLASHGGFLGVILAIVIFCRRYQLPTLWLLDRISMLALFAGGCIRLGNLFNSEIIGRITNVPWAFIFTKVDSLPRHPAQIYESLGYFISSAICYAIYRWKYQRNPPHGTILGWIFIFGFSFRFFVEFVKEHQVTFEQGLFLNMGQMLSIPFVLIGISLVYGLHRRFFTPCSSTR